jgi:hypothetical protein
MQLFRHRPATAAATAAAIAATLLMTNAARAAPATIEVDAREAPRGIQHVHLVLPVKPGKLVLLYPKWLPGEHAPTGPIGGLAGLKFSVNGRPLVWQRDADNMFAFHLAIPQGGTALDVVFEVDSVLDASDNNALRLSTDSLAIILWNQLVLYPAGTPSDDMRLTATLRLPAGWEYGTALASASQTSRSAGDVIQFAPVSLTTLIDSPVIAGRYFRTIELAKGEPRGTPAVYMHIAADSQAALAITPDTTNQFRNLVQEATALFGATHYDDYHFLLTLSDRITYEGIEHHQSSDNRMAERALIDDDMRHSSGMTTLLPHEYVHSWNGKYRRPIGLATDARRTAMGLRRAHRISRHGVERPQRARLPYRFARRLGRCRRLVADTSGARLATADRHRHRGADRLHPGARMAEQNARHRFLRRDGHAVARGRYIDSQQKRRHQKPG